MNELALPLIARICEIMGDADPPHATTLDLPKSPDPYNRSSYVRAPCKGSLRGRWICGIDGQEFLMSDHDTAQRSDRLKSIPVQLSVRVCQRNLTLSQFLQWSPGQVIEFDQPSNSPLLLQIDRKTVGQGVAVKIGSQLGICVRQVGGATPSNP